MGNYSVASPVASGLERPQQPIQHLPAALVLVDFVAHRLPRRVAAIAECMPGASPTDLRQLSRAGCEERPFERLEIVVGFDRHLEPDRPRHVRTRRRQRAVDGARCNIIASCSRSFQATSASPCTNERKSQTVMT